MRGERWVMTRSVSRSALLTKFQNVSEETETVVGLEGLCKSLSHSEWGWKYKSVLRDRDKNKQTNISNQCHNENVCVASRVPWWELQQRQSGVKKSNALWPLEWQNGTFMMSPRLFSGIDGLSRNADWLVHRLTECAAAVRLLSCSFSGQNIQPDTLERITNEGRHSRLRPHLPARVAKTRLLVTIKTWSHQIWPPILW